ncbi:hypothetical protein OIO90_000899 [Microbotryomycetes sp. JL221]|nr:hypothetical protein OIO90_000899 [Microbotryomycetes sp. JL221]
MANGDSNIAPERAFATATTFLHDLEPKTVVVPTRFPVSSSSAAASPELSLHASLASTSLVVFPHQRASTNDASQHGQSSTRKKRQRSAIMARTVDNGYSLQLELVATTTSSSSASGALASPSPRPVKLEFPSRLLPTPSVVLLDDEADTPDELQVYAVTEAGLLYVMRFTGPRLFYSQFQQDEQDDVTWCEEYKIQHFANAIALGSTNVPVLMHGVDEAHIVVASSDGSAVSIVLSDNKAGSLIETELKPASSSFSVRSLLPFSSRSSGGSPARNGSSSSMASAPSQLLSLASMAGQDGVASFAFGVSRDRKLKIWNLDTGACLRSIDLPKPISTSSTALVPVSTNNNNDGDTTDSPSISRSIKSNSLLPPSPQTFVKVILGSESSPFASYLSLIVPASSASAAACFIYGIVVDGSTLTVTELMPVCERVCPDSSASLVDFDIQQFGLGPDSSEWTLWTVWDEAGESVVRCTGVPEIEGADLSGLDEEATTSWTTINRGTAAMTSSWTPSYFDELLDNSPKSIPDVFMEHITYPGRYPMSALDTALDTYEQALQSGDVDMSFERDFERPVALSAYYDSAFDRIRAVVGCTIELEQSAATGAYLHDAYNKRIKTEWLKFVAMVNEARSSALFPTSLAVDASRQTVLVLHREAVSAPIVQDTVITLRHVASMSPSDERRSKFLTSPPVVFEQCYNFLSERSIRSDCVSILEAIDQIESSLTSRQLRTLDETIVTRVRAPFAFSVEDVALDLYAELLEPFVDDEAAAQIDDLLRGLLTPEASFQTLWSMLTSSDVVARREETRTGTKTAMPSFLTSGLLTDAVAFSIEARYKLARGLTTLLLFVCGEDSDLLPQLPSLLSATFASLHTLAGLKWIASQLEAPTAETIKDDDVLTRFGDMRVSNGADTSIDGNDSQHDNDEQLLRSSSLLEGLLRSRYAPELTTPDLVSLPITLTNGVSTFLHNLGLVKQKRLVVDTPSDVVFALRLCQYGLSRLAFDFINMFPTGAGMLFVRGLCEIDLGLIEQAQVSFAKAAPALFGENTRLDEDSGISHVLPVHALGSLGRYYRHVMSLFAESGADVAVLRFARLAIDTLAEEKSGEDLDNTLKDLWLQLFKSSAALGEFEEAYTAMMAMAPGETRNACLAHLISVMCETHHLEQLLSFSFVGLEADLERNLSFRARNSDPLSTPNYYTVLYSYHISRGDYRSAGTVMLQQARRLGSVPAHSIGYRQLATLQCQSYLAALNALSLVSKENAWIAVSSNDDPHASRTQKRRKINYVIPDEELTKAAGSPPDILEPTDVRREYTIALTRLQLSAEFPELERTNFSIDAEALVALLSQTGAFEQAFTLASTLRVDMSSLFELVAERCIALSQHQDVTTDADWVTMNEQALNWEGSLASKAWRLLQIYLDRYDTDGTNRGRLVALERAIALARPSSGPTTRLPTFLTDVLLEKDAHALIRTLIKHDRLGEAFRYSLQLVQAPAPSALASSSLPYSLFDQLLSIDSKGTGALSEEDLRSSQTLLRQAIEQRATSTSKSMNSALDRR